MSREVDERVVAMYFDNKDFEKNAQSTIKTLDELKKGLDLEGSVKGMENLAASYPGVTKAYAIQAGRELRVIVGAEQVSDRDAEVLSGDIAKKIQDEMTYPGQVKITVIRETRSVAYAK